MTTAPDWKHLLLIVDALVESGNQTVGDGFQPNQGGFDCLMRDPIDMSVAKPLVALDPHAKRIRLDEGGLDCSHCWAGVHSAT